MNGKGHPKQRRPGITAIDAVIVSADGRDIDALTDELTARGCRIERAHEPETVAAAVVGGRPAISVVDLRSDDKLAFRLLSWLCRNASCESVVVTTHQQVDTRLRAIEIGALHFLIAPFEIREAVAIVEALIERARTSQRGRVDAGDIKVDSAQRCITRSGETVPLTPRELDVLLVLVERSEQPVSKRELLAEIWHDDERSENVVEANVSSLRRKLHALGPAVIHTVHRKGYVFRPVSTSATLTRTALAAERDRLVRERDAVVARRDELLRRLRAENGSAPMRPSTRS